MKQWAIIAEGWRGSGFRPQVPAVLGLMLLLSNSACYAEKPHQADRPTSASLARGSESVLARVIPGISFEDARFTPEGSTVVYYGLSPTGWVVVSNGKAGEPFDGVGTLLVRNRGELVLYSARKGNRWVVVSNGEQGEMFDEVAYLGYVGTDAAYYGRREDLWYRVRGGRKLGTPLPGVIKDPVISSRDGNREAFPRRKGNQWCYQVDEEAGPLFDDVQSGTFSPDGKRFAYSARRASAWFVMTDGKQGSEFDRIGSIAFSPEGASCAYTAQRNRKWHVVFNDHLGPQYDEISDVVLGADGKSIAYAARSGARWFVLANEKQIGDAERVWAVGINAGCSSVTYGFKRGSDLCWREWPIN